MIPVSANANLSAQSAARMAQSAQLAQSQGVRGGSSKVWPAATSLRQPGQLNPTCEQNRSTVQPACGRGMKELERTTRH